MVMVDFVMDFTKRVGRIAIILGKGGVILGMDQSPGKGPFAQTITLTKGTPFGGLRTRYVPNSNNPLQPFHLTLMQMIMMDFFRDGFY